MKVKFAEEKSKGTIPKDTTYKQKARAFDLLYNKFPEYKQIFYLAVKISRSFK